MWWRLLAVLRGRTDGLVRALQRPNQFSRCYERLVEAGQSSVFLVVVEIRVSRPSGATVVW
jgi:hypothetical protein